MNKNIPVIYYHSVAPAMNPTWFKNFLTLELKYFVEHLKYFVKNDYKFIFLEEIFNGPKDPEMRRDKKVCLTFDDGYLDNFIYAFPLLKKYNAKGTIFVNPDFVDKQSSVRNTLDDYWNNRTTLKEINKWGFLSWDEMRVMEDSNLVNIQSHTMTHTKYFVSDKLIGFHHPGTDCLYYVGNEHPERLPYYIEDKEFEKLIPYGYPIFEQKSSLIARRVKIRQSFNYSIIQSLQNNDWSASYNFDGLFNKIKTIYIEAKESNAIIESYETEEEYKKRIYYELKESKEIIEKELNKKVNYCCWPHGDNNDFAHKTALEIGYKTTTQGKNTDKIIEANTSIRIPPRIGLSKSKNSVFLTRLKTHYKIKTAEHIFPYYSINKLYNKLRYGI